MTRSELTARFWTAAKFIRRCPDAPHDTARQLLRAVAEHATGTLQQRTAELIREDYNGPGTSYTG